MKGSQIREALEFSSDDFDPIECGRLRIEESDHDGQTAFILREIDSILAVGDGQTPTETSNECAQERGPASVGLDEPEERERSAATSTLSLDYFAIVRDRPDSAPNCFGALFRRDPNHQDCLACRFTVDCGITQQTNLKRYGEWLARNRVGEDDIGIVYSRNRRLAVTGAGAPPALSATPSTGWASLFRALDLAQMHRSNKKKRAADRQRKRVARSRPSYRERVENCAALRRTALENATIHRTKDKRAQQLRGRAEELALFWKATALATDPKGHAPSADHIARIYNSFVGVGPISRHSARTKQQLISNLEKPRGPWAGMPSIKELRAPQTAQRKTARGPGPQSD